MSDGGVGAGVSAPWGGGVVVSAPWGVGALEEHEEEELLEGKNVGSHAKCVDDAGWVRVCVEGAEATKVGQGPGTGSPCHPSSQLCNSMWMELMVAWRFCTSTSRLQILEAWAGCFSKI